MEELRRTKHGGDAAYPVGKLGGSQRGKLAKALQEGLCVSKETARGLVTKLKQTKRGKQLLFGAP